MLVLLLSTSGETNMLACYCVNCVAVCVCVVSTSLSAGVIVIDQR